MSRLDQVEVEIKPQQTACINKLFDQFLKQVSSVEGRSRVTIKNYRENFELLKKFKPTICLADLNNETMIDFFDFLDKRERMVGKDKIVRELKTSSRETIRGKLNAFFNWLLKNDYIGKSPFDGMKHPDVSYTDIRAFTKEEFDRIYLAVTRDMKWDNRLLAKRNVAIIMFLVCTGVRKNEFLNIKKEDLDLSQGKLTVRGETSKSKRTRVIGFGDDLYKYMEEYLEEIKDYSSPYLWVSNSGDWKLTEHGLKHLIDRLTRKTGINCHVHRFRHTFAVNLYRQVEDILLVYQALGHRSLKMTMSYLRSVSNDEYIQKVSKLTVAEFV